MFDISIDVETVTRMLDDLEKKQVPFATAKALTATAQHVKQELEQEMKRVFDRPTPYTLKALFLKAARKKDLIATVGLKDWAYKGTAATKYLMPQIEGGARGPKRSEALLRGRGILGNNQYIVPGKGTRLNKYGNMTRGQIQKALSNLKAQRDSYQNTTNKKKVAYFAGKINGTPGIWERRGRRVKPLFIFVKQPRYTKRFQFYQVAERTAAEHFEDEFDKALTQALATAY